MGQGESLVPPHTRGSVSLKPTPAHGLEAWKHHILEVNAGYHPNWSLETYRTTYLQGLTLVHYSAQREHFLAE